MRKRRKRHLRREGGQVLDERMGQVERRSCERRTRDREVMAEMGLQDRAKIFLGRRAYDSKGAGE